MNVDGKACVIVPDGVHKLWESMQQECSVISVSLNGNSLAAVKFSIPLAGCTYFWHARGFQE
eukprot:7970479-Lingulodinium_polyedra.AAC.1